MDGWLNWITDWIQSVFAARTLGVMLWVGLAVLTITLLVLMRSRWGQVKPLWKCVILSVLAHVLLGGYAYGTKLIFHVQKRAEADQPVNVVVHDPTSEPTLLEPGENGQRQHWENFASEPALEALASEPEKLAAQLENDTQRPQLADTEYKPRKITGEFVASQTSQRSDIQPQASDAHEIKNANVNPEVATVERRSQPDQPAELQATADSEPERLETQNKIELAEKTFDPNKTIEDSKSRLKTLENGLKAVDEQQSQSRTLQNTELQFNALGQTTDQRDSSATRLNQPNEPKRQQDVRRLGDGKPLPRIYSQRSQQTRKTLAIVNGATKESEAAVELALKWLSENQKRDGRWDASASGAGMEQKILGHDRQNAGADADTGITGLALLAFLAAGNTHLEGEYRETVHKGLAFLCSKQASNGSLQGDARLFARMYCHSMALLSLSEAYSMTGDQNLRPHLEAGVRYSVGAQNQTDGGWRYQPGDQGDMSQFGWQVMALVSARNGGIEIDDRVFDGMQSFLNACSSGTHGGLAAYRPHERPSSTMTAEALVCRCFLQNDLTDATTFEATDRIDTRQVNQGRPNFYYWYYATLALHQTGGDKWDDWHAQLRDRLVDLQRNDGYDAGSWDANGVWSGYGGRVYSTAMATLSLEIYYRYLPLAKRK